MSHLLRFIKKLDYFSLLRVIKFIFEKRFEMGIFDKIFKSERDIAKEEIQQVPWLQLTELDQLDALLEESTENTVVILKHSTSCGISRMVLRQFESSYAIEDEGNVKLYFLDLLSYREISNEIANRFKVRHESPQMIVLRDKNVIHHASHQGISADKLKELV